MTNLAANSSLTALGLAVLKAELAARDAACLGLAPFIS
jgi:hypothetical protein